MSANGSRTSSWPLPGRRRLLVLAVCVAATAGMLPATARPPAATVDLISATPAGVPANEGASDPAMTPDGRFVAFASYSSNLVSGDTNGASDVFVRDTRTGAVERVSVNSKGAQGTRAAAECALGASPSRGQSPTGLLTGGGGAGSPAISKDGRYVAFLSCFVNFATPTSLYTQVYVRDRHTGKTTLASIGTHGASNSLYIAPPVISGDGRYVVFATTATNLADDSCAGDPVSSALCANGVGSALGIQGWQVYRHDMVTGKTQIASVSSSDALGNGDSFAPFVSADGRYVGFESTSDNLTGVPATRCTDVVPACEQVYLHDMKTGATQMLSSGIDGRAGNGPAGDGTPASGNEVGRTYSQQMSADDRYVLFMSSATNLIPHSPTQLGESDFVFVRDVKLGRTEHVSVTSTGSFPGANPTDATGTDPFFGAQWARLSPDGRYVAFLPICGQWNGATGFWIHDRLTGDTDYAVPSRWGNPPTCAQHGAGGTLPPEDVMLLGDKARYAVFAGTPGAFFNDGDSGTDNAAYQVMIADRGPDRGIGSLVSSGRLSVAGAPGFRSSGSVAATGLVTPVDDASGVDRSLIAAGAELIQASLAYRAAHQDLFVRLDVAQMPLFSLASPAVVYGLNLTVDGVRYQVRVAKTSVLDASFGLFRQEPRGSWRHVATLRGGYGTTGQEVVFALPLQDVGAQRGGRISDAVAFTGIGSYLTGVSDSVDEIALSR